MTYNIVITEYKTHTSFLNLSKEEFFKKLWEWTYEDDLWDYLEESNPTNKELEDALNQFIRDNMFHEYEDDDVDCFAFINDGDCIKEYQIDENIVKFVHGKIKEYNSKNG